MIDCNEIKPLLNKYVGIGVPHDIIPGKLFFYYGYLKYVNSTDVKIETRTGYKIIPIDRIMDIHARGGKQ